MKIPYNREKNIDEIIKIIKHYKYNYELSENYNKTLTTFTAY